MSMKRHPVATGCLFCYILYMKYDMLQRSVAKRILDAFYGRSFFTNKKYEGYRKVNKYWNSDRERFAGRFFKQLEGKYFALMDIEIVAFTDGNYATWLDTPQSVFGDDSQVYYFPNGGTPVKKAVKKFLRVDYVHAENEASGDGYVAVGCHDHLGNNFRLRINKWTLPKFQFKEITQDEFDAVAAVFQDDRDTRPFKVTRYLTVEEMKERGLFEGSSGAIKETVIVDAKDADDAYTKLSNTIEAETC